MALGSMQIGRISSEIAMAAGAFWYDMHLLDISGEADDVVCDTKYPGEVVSGLANNSATDTLTVIVQTKANHNAGKTDNITLRIPAASAFGRVPPLQKIVKTGTGDGLVLFTHRT